MNNSNSGFELWIGRIMAVQALFNHSIWFAVSLKKNKKRKLHWKLTGFPSRTPVLALKTKPTTPRGFVAPQGGFLSSSAWAPVSGFGLMDTAGTGMWPICLHAHISAFVLHCDMVLEDNGNIPFCLRMVSQFGNRSGLLFTQILLASSVLLSISLPFRAVPPAAALQTSSNPRAPLAACLASLMCHAYQLIPYCSGPFPMQDLWSCWRSSLQSGWKRKRDCAFFHRRQPRVKPSWHLPTLWDLYRLLRLLCAPAEMNIMIASIHLTGLWYVLKQSHV